MSVYVPASTLTMAYTRRVTKTRENTVRRCNALLLVRNHSGIFIYFYGDFGIPISFSNLASLLFTTYDFQYSPCLALMLSNVF